MRRRNITMKVLAELCGVSRGTVDRALHGRKGIDPETKAKILRIAQEMGYRPNFVARSLAKGKTRTIGMVVFDLYNRFFAQVVNAAEEEARNRGCSLFLGLTNKDQSEEWKYLERLVSWRVDGIILAPVGKDEEIGDYLRHLVRDLGITTVTICNRIGEGIPFVGIRDYEVTRSAVKTIAARGYRRIVFLCPPLRYRGTMNLYASEERLRGYLDAIRDLELHDPQVIGEKDFLPLVQQIVAETRERVAVLCSSDLYALEVLSLLQNMGIRVPEEVGLVGFDDIDTLQYVKPLLSTIPYPVAEVGKKAVTIVSDGFAEEKVGEVYLETGLVIRESL